MRETITSMVIILFFLIGCAATTKKVWTEQEWTQMTVREFKGKTSKEILDAAQKVLLLADESDVKIYRFPNKLVGTRKYNAYMVLAVAQGVFNFEIQTEEKENKIITRLFITHSGSGISGAVMPGAAGGYSNPQAMIVPTPTISGEIIDFEPVYILYFLRMESLLYGKSWITCYDADDIFKRNYKIICNNSQLEALCFLASDKVPEGVPLAVGISE